MRPVWAAGVSGGMSSSWAESALNWWSEAGVDTLVAEEPRNWLEHKPPAKAPAPAAPAEAIPDTLDAFRAWFVDPARLPKGTRAIAPSGDPASGLMVLVDMPGAQDRDALISGAPGTLFDNMLAAMKPPRSRDTIYLAPLTPVRTPTGRIDPGAEARLAGIARHHIALAKPEAVLLFGDACAKALLGGAVAATRGRWHEISTPAGPVRAVATLSPEFLDRQPAQKKLAWEDLQMLMEGLTA